MMKFDALNFVNSLACDLTGEFDELEEMIQGAENGVDNVDAIRKTYTHLGSLLQGIEYMLDFINDDDDRKELAGIIARHREERDNFYPRCASLVYSKELRMPVTVEWWHNIDKPDQYMVDVFGKPIEWFDRTEEVKAYINKIKAA